MLRPTVLSCGVLVTDGARLLLGHATGSSRWDIPKGLAEPGEAPAAAARRELEEETGLLAPPDALEPLGTFAYRPGKRLALFRWCCVKLPEPATLHCRSMFTHRRGTRLPEFDAYMLAPWDDALERVGTSLRKLLSTLTTASHNCCTSGTGVAPKTTKIPTV